MDFDGLAETGRTRLTQSGCQLAGLCYSDGTLYVVEQSDRESCSLTVYRVQSESGDVVLLEVLDRLALPGTGEEHRNICPRVDRHSRRVFVPCGKSGVTVARLDGDRLVKERSLICVEDPISVDAMLPDRVYVADASSGSVHLVDVRGDRIRSTLEKPDRIRISKSHSLAVPGNNIIVSYGDWGPSLVLYTHGSRDPVREIYLWGLGSVSAVSTDWQHHNFLVTDFLATSVLVITVSERNYCHHHRVKIDTDKFLLDCAVVSRRLWVCEHDDIVIMSSQPRTAMRKKSVLEQKNNFLALLDSVSRATAVVRESGVHPVIQKKSSEFDTDFVER